jgi:hypothetical protein
MGSDNRLESAGIQNRIHMRQIRHMGRAVALLTDLESFGIGPCARTYMYICLAMVVGRNACEDVL